MPFKQNIKGLYPINLIEGEGLGTSYEYYAKFKRIARFMKAIESPQKILIAGLPEKYGLSMDFFLLGEILGAEVLCVDERGAALEKAQQTLFSIESMGHNRFSKVRFFKVERLSNLESDLSGEAPFDLALSSEVLQRLGEDIRRFVSSITKMAQSLAFFVPNSLNESHARLSGLKGFSLKELLLHFKEESDANMSVLYSGHLDMPLFPPGLSRSQEERQRASESRIEGFLMKTLELYCYFEHLIPEFVQAKIAHIVYLMAKRE